MDWLPDLETLSAWLAQYGSLFLFLLLALGIIAFPVPEETLMLITGILIRKGTLPLVEASLAAWLGSVVGITGSYLIGQLAGIYVITSFGSWIGLTKERIDKAHIWFEKYGKWALFIGYFIPGIRHFTGLSAGAARLDFRQFMLFAYTGALFWVSLFISSGYFFGHLGLELYEKVEVAVDEFFIAVVLGCAVAAVVAFYFYKRKKS